MTRPFTFFRAGGFDQVHFATGSDLVSLDKLDPRLWVALACPVKGLAFDARTLELIDTEKDGRIRVSELVAAATWTGTLLRNPDELLAGKAELPLASISDTDEGKGIATAARAMLKSLGKPAAAAISVTETQDAVKAFDAQPFNGDGVLTLDSASAADDKALLTDLLACVKPATDRSGKPGVTVELAASFFKAIAEHVAWLDKAGDDALPLKADTAAAHAALEAVRAKVDDYFTRCRVVAFDARAAVGLNRDDKEFLAIGAKDLTLASLEIAALPLARVDAQGALPLSGAVNPAWATRLVAFAAKVVTPVLGAQPSLTEAQWGQLTARFTAFEAWLGTKAGGDVEKLGADRVRALAKVGARAGLDALFALEKEQEPSANSMHKVEKLARCYRDLHRLATNFVSFRDFYERKTPAVFQAGTLYLDQRTCELCIRVEDAGKHSAVAGLASAFLAYCDCVKPATGEKQSIVAAFTAGNSDNLMVGRNGVFIDRDGREWDATITKLVDNPISIRQAFWSPYKKLLRFVEDQVAKRAADEEKESNALLTASATSAAKAADTGKVEKPPKKLDIGVVAALGVAVGGITAALGALLQAVFGLGLWMPLGVVGLVMLISGPSMLIAWLKLRQRNIGPLLEANGWAVNANARINVPFGASLTRLAVKPAGSRVDTTDPWAEARRPWKLYFTLLVLLSVALAWYLGKIDHLLPAGARSVSVLKSMAPAAEAPPEAPKP